MYPAGGPPDKELQTNGRGTISCRSPRNATRPAIRSALGSALHRRGRHGSARCSPLRRPTGRCQRQHHGKNPTLPDRCSNGSRSWCQHDAGERLRLGQCRRTTRRWSRGRRPYHQPPLGLGGGQARRAESRRAIVDLPVAEGPARGALTRPIFGFWGIWKFSKNIPAAKSLLTTSAPGNQEKLVEGEPGFDIPPFAKLHDFKAWDEDGPPKGTVYNYPPRDDVTRTGYPAPFNIGSRCMRRRRCAKWSPNAPRRANRSMRRSITPPRNWKALCARKGRGILRAGAPRGAVNSAGF